MKHLLNQLNERSLLGRKSIALLIDPDDVDLRSIVPILNGAIENKVDYIFIGGSLVTSDHTGQLIDLIKDYCQIPVVIFPGNAIQIHPQADALLFLSLISGRNPELLIGQHVVSAPLLKRTNLEVIPTGYMLIHSGRPTSVSYMSNTTPIPGDKPNLAVSTALAGEMLGLRLIYMDGGSGAEHPISARMIRQVKNSIKVPLIVGGGLNTMEKAKAALSAGADLIVVGNGVQKNPNLLIGVCDVVQSFNQALNVN